jgi:SPP1 gp7 family putative phage head morphogenesis protein
MSQYERYVFYRSLDWRLTLDQWEAPLLERLSRGLDAAKKEVMKRLSGMVSLLPGTPEWGPGERDRLEKILSGLVASTEAVQAAIAGQAQAMGDVVARKTIEEYNDIFSIEDTLKINTVAPTKEQIQKVLTTPLGGTFSGAFDYHLNDRVIAALDAGTLAGVGLKPLADMVSANWSGGLKRDVISLTRTHVQAVQNEAAKAVAAQNRDILQSEWEWCAILDNRACLSCMGLDGRLFSFDDEISIPYHVRCRCIRKWKTKPWAEITKGQINIPEAEKKMRNWTWRKGGNIDIGGKKLLSYGKMTGTYEDFFNQLSFSKQTELVGITRAKLLRDGEISFNELTTPRGEVYTLATDRKGLSGQTYQ